MNSRLSFGCTTVSPTKFLNLVSEVSSRSSKYIKICQKILSFIINFSALVTKKIISSKFAVLRTCLLYPSEYMPFLFCFQSVTKMALKIKDHLRISTSSPKKWSFLHKYIIWARLTLLVRQEVTPQFEFSVLFSPKRFFHFFFFFLVWNLYHLYWILHLSYHLSQVYHQHRARMISIFFPSRFLATFFSFLPPEMGEGKNYTSSMESTFFSKTRKCFFFFFWSYYFSYDRLVPGFHSPRNHWKT